MSHAARSSSTKSVSDVYSPVTGEVAEVNSDVDEDPGLVNSDPYGAGWLMKIELGTDEGEPTGLLTADEYAELTAEQDD